MAEVFCLQQNCPMPGGIGRKLRPSADALSIPPQPAQNRRCLGTPVLGRFGSAGVELGRNRGVGVPPSGHRDIRTSVIGMNKISTTEDTQSTPFGGPGQAAEHRGNGHPTPAKCRNRARTVLMFVESATYRFCDHHKYHKTHESC